MVIDKKPLKEIVMEARSYQAVRFAEKAMEVCLDYRTTMPTIYWFFGESGSGKTRWAFDKYGYENVYVKNCSHKWWNGYTQQKCILLDDFEKWLGGS